MGTFTFPYFLRNAIWEKKGFWILSAAAYYYGRCWDAAGMHKAEMMKGHSKMYANRHLQLPKTVDAWKY